MKYFRKLVGEKCYLSPINPDDVETYTQWINDLEVTAYLYLSHQVISLPKEREILEKMAKEGHVFAIVDIMLRVFSFNQRALQCYRKCGFKEIGIRRKARIIGRKEYDVLYMDILSEEFTKSVIDDLI